MWSPTFALLKPASRLRAVLRSLGLPSALRRDDVCHLPPYLLRDIGLSERRQPDWDRELR